MAVTPTVICHFYNEEFLLPYWLKHHKRLFQHGVLIDNHSTDSSSRICEALAPDWELRKSDYTWFAADEVDRQVMRVEEESSGWKLVLNTTEFLLCNDLSKYLRGVEEYDPQCACIGIRSIIMVDNPDQRFDIITEDPLYFQKHHGYYDPGEVRRLRFLHRHANGRYHIGRHGTDHNHIIEPDIRIQWWGWSPIEYIRNRKLQIQTKIPESDRIKGFGNQHIVTAEELELKYNEQAKMSIDLLNVPSYVGQIAALRSQSA